MGERHQFSAWILGGLLAACGEVQGGDAEVAPAGESASSAPALAFPAPVESPAGGPAEPSANVASERAPDPLTTRVARPSDTVTAEPRTVQPRPAAAPDWSADAASSFAGALDREIDRIAANAIRTAREASKGKAHGGNTTIVACVIDAKTGAVLAERGAGMALTPASNLKLFTVAAGARVLGLDAEWTTPFEIHGEVMGGTLRGDLVVRAGGDPLHRREGDGSIDAWIEPLVRRLRDAGIRRIEGGLVLDEGAWLEPGPGPEWPSTNQYWTDYCAFAAGLTANGSCFRARVDLPAGASRASITLRPRHHGLAEKLGVRAGDNAIRIGATASTVTVGGTCPSGHDAKTYEFSHPDPVMLFGHAFTGALRDRGIDVRREPVKRRGVPAADGATRRVVHTMRTKVASTYPAILLDSNNPVADQVFLTLGDRVAGRGTRDASARVVREAVGELGVSTDGLVIVGGSGLSKANRVTPRQLATLVARVLHDDATHAAFDALPVAGRTGSLSKRMRGTSAEGRVRAKTGWVAGASGLSGVATTLGGRELAFSILVSYPRVGGLNNAAWKPMQNEMCEAMVEWGADAPRVR